jgi:hypothetical protein
MNLYWLDNPYAPVASFLTLAGFDSSEPFTPKENRLHDQDGCRHQHGLPVVGLNQSCASKVGADKGRFRHDRRPAVARLPTADREVSPLDMDTFTVIAPVPGTLRRTQTSEAEIADKRGKVRYLIEFGTRGIAAFRQRRV